MEFRYQKFPSENAVALESVKADRIPLLIDYSDKYTYNQPRQIDEVIYREGFGLDYDVTSDTFSIGGGAFSISTDNLVITSKVTRENVPLYYQYQLKYDVLHPENIRIFDGDNNEVVQYIEYGYVGSEHYPLEKNTAIEFDSLDAHTELGILDSSYPILFASISSIEDDINNKYDNLPFNIYGDCLGGGHVQYSGDIIPEDGVLEFYFALREIKGSQVNIIEADDWELYVDISQKLNGQLDIDFYKWYRIKIDFNSKKVILFNDSTPDPNEFVYNDLIAQDFTLIADYGYIFDLALFEDITDSNSMDWDYPLYVHRYSKSLIWKKEKPVSGPYRIRILLPDNAVYTVRYDAVAPGSTYRNLNEWVSPRLVYKKYSNITANDWYYDGYSTIYFVEHAHDDLKALYEANDPDSLDGIYVYTRPTSKDRVQASIYDDRVLIQNGTFLSDDYNVDVGEGHPDYNNTFYYVPEYRLMPVASDNQVIVEPKYLRSIRKKAEIVDSHTIKVNTFYFYEGNYPDYDIPGMIEKYYDIDTDTITSIGGDDLKYRNARGINIYIKERGSGNSYNLIPNDEIVDYNMSQGLIRLRRVLNVHDEIRVSYLEKIDGFICPYPRIDRLTNVWDSYRIYLRPYFPNYRLEYPGDSQFTQRLCYRKLVNGEPVGGYYDCLTNEEVPQDSGSYIPNPDDYDYYEIADITVFDKIEIDDIRIFGGGIKEDDYFGGMDERIESFPFSQAYLDIMNVDGLQIPEAITFIKIHSDLINNLVAKYEADGRTETDALNYLKRHIEKHIGIGVFFAIVNENDQLINDPFPNNNGGTING